MRSSAKSAWHLSVRGTLTSEYNQLVHIHTLSTEDMSRTG
jgi:hypothetical protein